MNVLLIGFILLLLVIIIWMLLKINDQSRQITMMQQPHHVANTDVFHTVSKPILDYGLLPITNAPLAVMPETNRTRINGQDIVIRLNEDPEEETPTTHGADYYETIQRDNHADDTQNVHDSTVIKELKRRYDRLMELNQKALQIPTELEGHMTAEEYADTFCHSMFVELGNYCQSYFDPVTSSEKFNKAHKVIETASKGSIFTGFIDEIREDWILAHVWYRIHSDENTSQKEQLLNALMDQLQDAGKYAIANPITQVIRTIAGLPPTNQPELTTECTTGRIGRYFQTFTLLDADPILQRPIMDEKEYENEAFAKSYKILCKTIDETPGMDLLYHNPDENALSQEDRVRLDEMKESARKAIAKTIQNDYDGIISSDKLDRIIEKCIAGV